MKKEKRNSSLDLLKIICMILIIAHHYVLHGGYEYVSLSNISASKVFLQEVGMYGSLCCNIFAMITGYYMVNSKFEMEKFCKKLARTVLEVYFYSIVIYAIFIATGIKNVMMIELIKTLLPLLWGNWYIIAYVLFYLFTPFINMMLNKLTKRQHGFLCILLLLVWSVIPTFTKLIPAWSWSNVDFFLVMYVVGAYHRLYGQSGEKIWKKDLINGVLSIVLIVLSVVALDYLGIKSNSEMILDNATYFVNHFTILSVYCAISWFKFFSNINFSNKFISEIAGSVFAVYLIHENDNVRPWLWTQFFPNAYYVDNPYIHFMIKTTLVFLVCVAIDFIRKELFSGIEKRIVDFSWKFAKFFLYKE